MNGTEYAFALYVYATELFWRSTDRNYSDMAEPWRYVRRYLQSHDPTACSAADDDEDRTLALGF